MPDLDELLTAEAIRQQPSRLPEFADLAHARARRRQRTRLITGAALVILAGAGITASIPDSTPASPSDVVRAPAGRFVTVTGSLQQVGGPMDTPPRGIPGTIRFQAEDGTITATTAAETGRFTISVPTGRYVVTGSPTDSPQTCQASAPVTVPTDGSPDVTITCHIR
ncbi:hypothetical protein [Actinoplanes sp. NPDC026670]|uniref:hypothetical protein n=1 Tax=Actinoplanes sp. NPDC026670 TaxID=3154700 RepID=UPI0033DBB993